MKSIVMPVPEQLKEETKQHPDSYRELTELKETVAKEAIVKNMKKKTFTVQEMWNRQRRMRSASDMMRRWKLN